MRPLTLPSEKAAADNLSHGGHLLLLQLLWGNTGVEIIQQLTAEENRGRNRKGK